MKDDTMEKAAQDGIRSWDEISQHTNSTPIECSGNNVAVQVQVLVENGRIELDLAVEDLADLLPACRGMSCVHLRSPRPHVAHQSENIDTPLRR